MGKRGGISETPRLWRGAAGKRIGRRRGILSSSRLLLVSNASGPPAPAAYAVGVPELGSVIAAACAEEGGYIRDAPTLEKSCWADNRVPRWGLLDVVPCCEVCGEFGLCLRAGGTGFSPWALVAEGRRESEALAYENQK